MAGLTHPIAASAWSLSGSMLTFAIPMGLLIVAATVLYLQFSRPHRIPGHSDLVPAKPVPPDLETAHAMAAAAGMTEAGAGADPLPHEPAGALELAEAAEQDRPAAVHLPGAAGQPEQPEQPGAGPADPLGGTGADRDPAAPEAGE